MIKSAVITAASILAALVVAYGVGVSTHQALHTDSGPAFLIFVGAYFLTFAVLDRKFQPQATDRS